MVKMYSPESTRGMFFRPRVPYYKYRNSAIIMREEIVSTAIHSISFTILLVLTLNSCVWLIITFVAFFACRWSVTSHYLTFCSLHTNVSGSIAHMTVGLWSQVYMIQNVFSNDSLRKLFRSSIVARGTQYFKYIHTVPVFRLVTLISSKYTQIWWY